VLDAACGEGYGSFLLAHEARTTTGVDVSAAAVVHARSRYERPNLAFVAASVTALPLPAGSVDLVVSFETIEHLAAQREMLAEFRRVLAPDGVLAISSPNRPVYNEGGGVENHFHVRELDRSELKALLDPAFPRQAWFAQRVIAQSALWAEGPGGAAPSFVTLSDDRPASAPWPAAPMYFVVLAAAADVALPALPALSLFDDGAQALWRDYARALLRERELAWEELDARKVAEDRQTQLVQAVNALASEREAGAVRAQRIAALEAELAQLQVRFAAEAQAHAHTADRLAREHAAHEDARQRLAYRESVRGWLRYPLAAARRRVTGPR
jgi:SAM-dependent methyltransferase